MTKEREFTRNQLETIIEVFRPIRTDQSVFTDGRRWEPIIRKLLTEGKCVAAGGNPWTGSNYPSIGREYIDYKISQDAIGCTEFTMDVEKVLSLKPIKEKLEGKLEKLKNNEEYHMKTISTINKERDELLELLTSINQNKDE